MVQTRRTIALPTPRWPPGVVPWVDLVAFNSSLAIAFLPASRPIFPLNHLYKLAMAILGTDARLRVLMATAVAAHLVEALYVLSICSKHRLPAGSTLGWFLLTCLLGYPAIGDLRHRLPAATTTSSSSSAGKGGSSR